MLLCKAILRAGGDGNLPKAARIQLSGQFVCLPRPLGHRFDLRGERKGEGGCPFSQDCAAISSGVQMTYSSSPRARFKVTGKRVNGDSDKNYLDGSSFMLAT